MKDGTEVNVMRWIPDGEIKGLIQISHGMAEHCMRYDRLGSIFAENGFVVSAHDHRGHGKTAHKAKSEGNGDFGYLADKNGFDKVESDLEEVILNLKADYPQKKIFLVGHSFGSMISQYFMEKNGDLVDGVVLSGTAGPRQVQTRFAKFVFSLNALLFGKRHKASMDSLLTFGSYNKGIKPRSKSKYDWLSRNQLNVQMYDSDKWCGFTPSAEFFCELVGGLCKIHSAKSMRQIPQTLPVYMTYGSRDPVGGYGKTIKKLCNTYISNGMADVSIKEWPEDRHEIFNEVDADTVIADTMDWINRHLA